MRSRVLLLCLAFQLLAALSARAESTTNVPSQIEAHSIQSDPISPTANCARITRGKYAINIRKGSGNNFICTPWLEIRSPDALVAVQSGSKFCQVVVLRGTATIKNTLEKHIVRVSANGVYQSRLQDNESNSATNGAAPLLLENLINLRSERPVFATARTLTTIGQVSRSALQISSFAPYADCRTFTAKSKEKIASIISPPTLMTYEIGPDVAKSMPILPELLHNFPPNGIINLPDTHLAGESQLAL